MRDPIAAALAILRPDATPEAAMRLGLAIGLALADEYSSAVPPVRGWLTRYYGDLAGVAVAEHIDHLTDQLAGALAIAAGDA